MTRHGKNCTASAVYSYHERHRDAKVSGYGTLHARLGADSIKEFDCCSLTLQPCKDPVITPNGYLFDREAILEYILAQTKAIAKKTKEWEKQCDQMKTVEEQATEAAHEEKVKKFAISEGTSITGVSALKRPSTTLVNEPEAKVKAHGKEGEISNMKGDMSSKLPSFWIPELNPTANATKLEKPSQKVLCPISEKPIRMKDLMEVKFTKVPEDKDGSGPKKDRYMCPVTYDVFTNTSRCAYLKPSKAVVAYSVVEKLIKKDWIDPVSGKKITQKDIIELQRGGTGFSATNEVKAKLLRPQLELQ
ncbi:unnamed protein product [Auanema sp. JU1783]|nr:unnamed protein product [Auanema sp. JU1783]